MYFPPCFFFKYEAAAITKGKKSMEKVHWKVHFSHWKKTETCFFPKPQHFLSAYSGDLLILFLLTPRWPESDHSHCALRQNTPHVFWIEDPFWQLKVQQKFWLTWCNCFLSQRADITSTFKIVMKISLVLYMQADIGNSYWTTVINNHQLRNGTLAVLQLFSSDPFLFPGFFEGESRCPWPWFVCYPTRLYGLN